MSFRSSIILSYLLYLTSPVQSQTVEVSEARLSGHQVITSASFRDEVSIVVTGQAGIFLNRFDGKQWVNVPLSLLFDAKPDSIKLTLRSRLAYDKDGSLWVTSHGGVYKLVNDGWKKFVVGDTLDGRRTFRGLAFDKTGNTILLSTFDITKWETNDHGVVIKLIDQYAEVYKLRDNSFTLLRSGNVMETGDYQAVAVASDGRVAIAAGNSGNNLLLLDGNEWTETKLISEYGSDYHQDVAKILADENGGLWFAYKETHWDKYVSGGLSYYLGGTWTHFTRADGMLEGIEASKTGQVTGLAIDENGNKWIGMQRGIVRIDKDMKLEVMDRDRLDRMAPSSVAYVSPSGPSTIASFPTTAFGFMDLNVTTTENGDVWFGTVEGILRYTPQQSSVLLSENGDQFSVYPNPATDNVTVEHSGSLREIKIRNTVGAEQLSWQTQTSGKVSLDVSHLAAGLYFVDLISDQGFTSQKIVVY